MARRHAGRRGNTVHAESARIALAAGVAGGVVAALGGASPTGTPVWDPLLVVGLTTAAAWAAASTPWWCLVVGAGALALAAPVWWALLVAAAVAAVGAAVAVRRVSWGWARGAAVAALAAAGGHAGNRWWFGATSALVVGAVAVAAAWGAWRRPADVRRRVAVAAGALGGVVVVMGLVFVLGALSARADLSEGERLARQGLAEAQRGDTEAAQQSLADAAAAFARADDTLGAPWMAPIRLVPVAAQHHRAVADLSEAAVPALRDAAAAIGEVDADRLRLVNGRFDLDAIRSLGAPFARLTAAVDALAAAAHGPDRQWLAGPVQERLRDLDDELARNRRLLANAAETVRLAPDLLGGEGRRRYFVAFVTPAEARGLVGFMGNWAEITVTDGRIEMTAFGRTDDLNTAGDALADRRLTGPEEFLARYGEFGFAEAGGATSSAAWKNITMPADLPTVADVIAQLYPMSGGQEIDGVFVLDVAAIAALMEFTGPVRVDGVDRQITAATAEGFLLRDQYELEREDRKDMLDAIARAVVEDLLTSSLPDPTSMARTFGPLVPARHVMAWSTAPEEQALFELLRMDGSLATWLAGSDGLVVARNNAAANKMDAYVTVETVVGAAGAAVVVANTAPAAGLPEYVAVNTFGLPPGTARTRVTVYSTREVAVFSVNGEPFAVSAGTELGMFAYTFVLDLEPGDTITFDVEWAS